MSFVALALPLAAFLAQAPPSPPSPEPAKPPRALVNFDLDLTRPRAPQHRDRERDRDLPIHYSDARIEERAPGAAHGFGAAAGFVAYAQQLVVSTDRKTASTPAARLLAALVEETLRATDATAACYAQSNRVIVECATTDEPRARELVAAASRASRTHFLAVEARFITPGPRSIAALEKAGLRCRSVDGQALVQRIALSDAQMLERIVADSNVLSAPKVPFESGQAVHVETADSIAALTDFEPVVVEGRGVILDPKITTFPEGLDLVVTGVLLPRAAADGRDRIAFEIDFANSVVTRPIAEHTTTIAGHPVTIQLPRVETRSLHATFTCAPDERLLIAGLTEPGGETGKPARPILLEIAARVVRAEDVSLEQGR